MYEQILSLEISFFKSMKGSLMFSFYSQGGMENEIQKED